MTPAIRFCPETCRYVFRDATEAAIAATLRAKKQAALIGWDTAPAIASSLADALAGDEGNHIANFHARRKARKSADARAAKRKTSTIH